MDSKIGKHGGKAPKICAATLQPCAGRHASHYSIGNGYYIAIMEKAAMGMSVDDIDGIKKRCRKLIPSVQHKTKQVIKKAEES